MQLRIDWPPVVMSDDIQVDDSRLYAQLERMAQTSTRDLPVLAREAMKGALARVIEITPPAYIMTGLANGSSDVVIRGDARKHGQSLVKGDIMSIYGTAAEAFSLMKAKEPQKARGFWRHIKDGQTHEASEISREVLGKGVYKFDAGQTHKNLKKGRARGRSRSKLVYTFETAALKQYIKDTQDRIGWLAGGWNDAAVELGVKTLAWIAKHDAPGAVYVHEDEHGINIVATNKVKYAGAIKDIQRRINWALNAQADAIGRRVDSYLAKKFRETGLPVAGALS